MHQAGWICFDADQIGRSECDPAQLGNFVVIEICFTSGRRGGRQTTAPGTFISHQLNKIVSLLQRECTILAK
jgi:hypothetical protein